MSTVKLVPHTLSGSADARAYVERTQCRVVKLAGDFGQAGEFKAASPGIEIVGRVVVHPGDYDPLASLLANRDPVADAQDYFNRHLRPAIVANPLVSAWEGNNEPTIPTAAVLNHYGKFCTELCRLIRGMGKRPVVGNFFFGGPHQTFWWDFGEGFAAIAQYDGWLGIHEYFCVINPRDWLGWAQARYHWPRNVARWLGYSIKIFVSETGLDNTNDGTRPWRQHYGGHGNEQAAQYVSELVRYHRVIADDEAIVGAAIFASGGPEGWRDFDVDNTAVLPLLAEQLAVIPNIHRVITPVCRVRSTQNGQTVAYLGIGDRVNVRRVVGGWCECDVPGITNPLWIGKSVLGKVQ